jgi:saccharopine dehydrogenase-like NADP-dependent oxidoreductase
MLKTNNTIALVGIGKMGYALVKLLDQFQINTFDCYDINQTRQNLIKNPLKLNNSYDLVILMLPPMEIPKFIKSNHEVLFKKQKVFLTITRIDYESEEKYNEFNQFLINNSISLVAGCGLEPGLTEIIAGYLASKHQSDKVDTIKIYCGGVPTDAKPPLFYSLVFGGYLTTEIKPALSKHNNTINHLQRFDELEKVFVPEIGLMEAYHDGMLPFFLGGLQIPNVSQKTLRWVGFTESIHILRQCGMLSEKNLVNYEVSPKEFLHKVLEENNLLKSENDMVILRIILSSKESVIRDFILTIRDNKKLKVNSMALATNLPILFFINHFNEFQFENGINWAFELFCQNKTEDLINFINDIC